MFYKLTHSVFQTKNLVIFAIIALLGGVAIRGATQISTSDARTIGDKSFVVFKQTVEATKSIGAYIANGFQRSTTIVSTNIDEWSQNTWRDITGNTNVAEKSQTTPVVQTPAVRAPRQSLQTNTAVVTPPTSPQQPQQTAHTLSVSKSGTGAGTVSSNPAGLTCGTTCATSFTQGTAVTLTALPNADTTFSGWGGDCNGVGSCTVTMTSAKNVTAIFILQNQTQTSYALSVSLSGNGSGTVVSSPSGINCGSACGGAFLKDTVITLTATPAQGSTFTGWGGACSGISSCSVSLNAAKNVTATFTSQTSSQASSTLLVSRSGSGSGTVTSAPSGINCGSTCSGTFSNGTAVTLTATPTSGSTFTGWSGACSGTGTCLVTLNSNQVITATFDTTPTGHEDPLVAEGFGAVTQGGNGGQTIYVTTLNPTGPGSLTIALATPGPRIIKFTVAGEIRIPDSFNQNFIWLGGINATSPNPAGSPNPQSYVTIDGASAPDPGITVTNGGFYFGYGVHDVIIRHIAIRVQNVISATSRGISVGNAYNVMVDHMTINGAVDEDIDFSGDATHDVTLQWSIIGPGGCCHPGKIQGQLVAHASGPFVSDGANRISIHHNIIAKEIQRTPLVYGKSGGAGSIVADVRNNLIYRDPITQLNTQIGFGANVNILNNFYLAGSGGPTYGAVYIITPDAGENYAVSAPPKVYLSGNISEPPANQTSPTVGLYQIGSPNGITYYQETETINTPYTTQTPFSVASVNTQSAVGAAQQVLSSAGARQWNRAPQEAALVGEIQNASTQVFNNLQNKNVALAKIPSANNSSQSQLLLIFLAMCVSSLLLSVSAFRVRL